MESTTIKTAIEIGHLAGQLTPVNQALVLNSVVTLLYAQENSKQIDNASHEANSSSSLSRSDKKQHD